MMPTYAVVALWKIWQDMCLSAFLVAAAHDVKQTPKIACAGKHAVCRALKLLEMTVFAHAQVYFSE